MPLASLAAQERKAELLGPQTVEIFVHPAVVPAQRHLRKWPSCWLCHCHVVSTIKGQPFLPSIVLRRPRGQRSHAHQSRVAQWEGCQGARGDRPTSRGTRTDTRDFNATMLSRGKVGVIRSNRVMLRKSKRRGNVHVNPLLRQVIV